LLTQPIDEEKDSLKEASPNPDSVEAMQFIKSTDLKKKKNSRR
jgi:hypothetical protein